MFASSYKTIIIACWVILAIFWLFDCFSWLIFLLLLVFSFKCRAAERECASPGKFLCPIDGTIEQIYADEERKILCVKIRSTLFADSAIRAPIDCESLSINSAADGKICVKFGDVSMEIRPSKYCKIHLLERYYDLARGSKFAHALRSTVLVQLPYDSRLEVGLGDKVLAASALARKE